MALSCSNFALHLDLNVWNGEPGQGCVCREKEYEHRSCTIEYLLSLIHPIFDYKQQQHADLPILLIHSGYYVCYEAPYCPMPI